jgi:hypothetical protein
VVVAHPAARVVPVDCMVVVVVAIIIMQAAVLLDKVSLLLHIHL